LPSGLDFAGSMELGAAQQRRAGAAADQAGLRLAALAEAFSRAKTAGSRD
jgi:hypothetical protein